MFFLLYSCATDELENELNRNRQLWRSHNLSNYSYIIEHKTGGIFRTLTATVYISNKSIYRLVSSSDSTEDNKYSINGAFKYVEYVIESKKNEFWPISCVHSYTVEYHKAYGFPTYVSIDQSSQDTQEATGRKITGFRVD